MNVSADQVRAASARDVADLTVPRLIPIDRAVSSSLKSR